MKNNILIIIVVTLVAIAVVAAVIIAGFMKDSGNSQGSESIPDWGGSYSSSDYSSTSDNTGGNFSSVPTASSDEISVNTSTSSSQSGSSSSAYSKPTASADSEFSAAGSIVATARSLIGVPFVMGGASSDGFDNPGFIYYVLRENGFHNCPRSLAKQAVMGQKLEFDELKAGDLVFFYDDYSATPAFGGIYIGDGKMVACLTPNDRDAGVMMADITTLYYQKRFFCGVSLS